MSPQRSDLVLTTYIPHCELDVLIFDSFDIEACLLEKAEGGEKNGLAHCFFMLIGYNLAIAARTKGGTGDQRCRKVERNG